MRAKWSCIHLTHQNLQLKRISKAAGGGPEFMCVWCWLANSRGCSRGSIPQSQRVLVLCPLCMCALGAAPRSRSRPRSAAVNAHIILGCGTKNEPNIYPTQSERAARWMAGLSRLYKNRSLFKSCLIWWFHLVFIIYNVAGVGKGVFISLSQ